MENIILRKGDYMLIVGEKKKRKKYTRGIRGKRHHLSSLLLEGHSAEKI